MAEETKVEVFDKNKQTQKLSTATVRHGGGGVMIWTCFSP